MSEHNGVLALTFLQSKPEKAADTLEKMDLKSIALFLSKVPYAIAGPVIACMLSHYAARVLLLSEPACASAFISVMNPRKAASILRLMDKKARKEILAYLPQNNATLLDVFLGYTQEMIGAWMIADIMLLPDDCTVGDALERLRNTDQQTHGGIVYVVNRNARLQGSLHVSALLRQSPDVPVASIMQDEKLTLSARATLHSNQDHIGWKTRNSLPVLNREKQLIGVLRHIDLYQGLRKIHQPKPTTKTKGNIIGLWSLYSTTLLALFDVISDCGAFEEVKKNDESLL